MGGLIIAGDRVDIIAVFDKETAGGVERSVTLLQDVEVLSVAQVAQQPVPPSLTADGSAADEGTEPATANLGARPLLAEPQPQARTVTLAVLPNQAQELALVDQYADLWLSLRPFEDSDTVSLDATNLDRVISGITFSLGR